MNPCPRNPRPLKFRPFPSRPSLRRAAALLIVLATLVIAVTAATVLARAASTARLHHRFDQCALTADDLLVAAEAPILDWLEEKSASIVLPPESVSPRVMILHDRWTIEGIDHELAITAFDQCGMAPHTIARGGSPLRLAVAPETLRRLDLAPSSSDSSPGLDWFAGRAEDEQNHDIGARVFPLAATSSALTFSAPDGGVAALGGDDEAVSDASLDIRDPEAIPGVGGAMGEVIATHNVDPVRININTAPIALVEAALRAAGRGGIEQIIEARKQGKPAQGGSMAVARGGASSESDGAGRLQIVTASPCWSFRIDIRVGPLIRSWWSVHQLGTNNQWSCVQRLAVNE